MINNFYIQESPEAEPETDVESLISEFNSNDYSDNASVSAVAIKNSEQVSKGKILSYIGDELRGVNGSVNEQWDLFLESNYIIGLTIYGDSNDNGKEVKFKYYDGVNLYDITVTDAIIFQVNLIAGSAIAPKTLNVID